MQKKYLIENLHLRVTSRCNFNCLHCYATSWRVKKFDLDKSIILSAISQALELGLQSVTFTGGEPLLHTDLTDIIKFCITKSLKVSIESNGYLIDQFIQEPFPELKSVKFNISYDGNYLRDLHKTNKVRRNISMLSQKNIQVRAQTVVTPLNIKEIDSIFSFTKQLGIKNRVFLGHNQVENIKNVSQFDIETLLQIKNRLEKKYNHLIIELPELITGKPSKGCG